FHVTGVQTCALPILIERARVAGRVVDAAFEAWLADDHGRQGAAIFRDAVVNGYAVGLGVGDDQAAVIRSDVLRRDHAFARARAYGSGEVGLSQHELGRGIVHFRNAAETEHARIPGVGDEQDVLLGSIGRRAQRFIERVRAGGHAALPALAESEIHLADDDAGILRVAERGRDFEADL